MPCIDDPESHPSLQFDPENKWWKLHLNLIRRLREEAGGMVTLMKEFIALPKENRLEGAETFCHQASLRLAAVESAMMEE